MTKPDRTSIVLDSDALVNVAYGCLANGTSPSGDLLDSLESEGPPGFEDGLDVYDILMDLIEAIARQEDLPESDHNYLNDGMWELKPKDIRLTFYDTDGRGHYVPKSGRRFLSRHYYTPEEMDPHIRLGHWFLKKSIKTELSDLNASYELRRQDLNHDLTATPSVAASPRPSFCSA